MLVESYRGCVPSSSTLSRCTLFVLADAAEAKVVRRVLVNSRDAPFKVEWVNCCSDASKRLGSQGGEEIAAVVVDLSLPDSQGMETVDALFRASPTFQSWS